MDIRSAAIRKKKIPWPRILLWILGCLVIAGVVLAIKQLYEKGAAITPNTVLKQVQDYGTSTVIKTANGLLIAEDNTQGSLYQKLKWHKKGATGMSQYF